MANADNEAEASLERTGGVEHVRSAVVGGDWMEKRQKAIEAWEWGQRMGYPLIRPGLEARHHRYLETGELGL